MFNITLLFLLQKRRQIRGKEIQCHLPLFWLSSSWIWPSKFDCDYAYVLGHISYHILAAGLNGYMATVTNLKNPVNKWRCGAAPITVCPCFFSYSCLYLLFNGYS